MAYETFRVEITRDETLASGGISIQIIAYIDRVPEHNEYTRGRLSRTLRGVWNSRLQFAGDFETLGEALAAVDSAAAEVDRIHCYEWTIDDETPVEVAPLVRFGDKWHPADPG